jgi:NTE family protein
MPNNVANNKPLSPDDFTQHPSVLAALKKLQDKFGTDYKGLVVSDTLDENGNQYVDLIQKGGGVLGVALAGYTFVLEEVGIRFLRLAGTSAGAINTALMAVIDDENDPRHDSDDEPVPETAHHGPQQGTKKLRATRAVLKYMSRLNFFDLVDGHPVARWVIKNFITAKGFAKRLKGYLVGLLIIFFGLLVLDVVFTGLGWKMAWASKAARVCYVLTGFVLVVLVGLGWYISFLYTRLKACGYGVNPGKFFYDWVEKVMARNDVTSISSLMKKVRTPIPGLHLRESNPLGVRDMEGDIRFITAELVSQNKIEFPRMWNLFATEPDELHPARFVRSSMAIPIFFESHIIPDIPRTDSRIQAAWAEHFGVQKEEDIPHVARFVDGGMLSNFPVNIFYNPRVSEPRLPTFGINLDDAEPDTLDGLDAPTWGLGGYFGRLLNTMRFYYDKDFMMKNAVFSQGVGTVKLAGFNWLNFFLSDEDKTAMFARGAEAAAEFLLRFDWQNYKSDRVALHAQTHEK